MQNPTGSRTELSTTATAHHQSGLQPQDSSESMISPSNVQEMRSEEFRSCNCPTSDDRKSEFQIVLELLQEMQRKTGDQFYKIECVVKNMKQEMKTEMEAMGGEIKAEMKAEMKAMKAEMEAMGGEMKAEMEAMGGGIKAEMRAEMKAMRASTSTELSALHDHIDAVNIVTMVKEQLQAMIIENERGQGNIIN